MRYMFLLRDNKKYEKISLRNKYTGIISLVISEAIEI